MKRFAKVLVVLFLLGLMGAWALLVRLDGLLKSTLLEAASRAVGDRYVVSIGTVDSEPFQGSVSLRDVSVRPAAGGGSPEAGFELSVQADRVSLEGLSYWALLSEKELRVEAIRVITPRVDYIYAAPSSVPGTSATMRPALNTQAPPSGEGSIGEIELRDASGSMRRSDRDSADLSIADLDIVLRDVRRSRTAGMVPAWEVASANVELHGVSGALPPLYDARIDSIAVAYPSCTAVLSGARIVPRADRNSYGDLVQESVELLDVDVPRLALQGVDLEALLRTRAIQVRKVEATGGHLYLDHDGRLPARPDRTRLLPRSGLGSMETRVRVDSIDIALDEFRYGERGAGVSGYGDIVVEHPRVGAARLRTQATGDDPDTLLIRVTGSLYGQGLVDARYSAAYGAKDDAFRLELDMGAMDFRPFGRLTNDMLKSSPVEGRIRSFALIMDGNDTRATGGFTMGYDGLRLEVLPEDGLKGKLLTGVANLAVIDANPKSNGTLRRVRLTVPRRKDRTIAAYIVGGLKEGVIRTMLPERIANAALEKAR